MTFIVIRPMEQNDRREIIKIHKKTEFENLSRSYIQAFLRELTAQLIVVVSAILFILAGIPLQFCWISIFIVAAVLLVAVTAGHLLNLQTKYEDLENIEEIYTQNQKCGFWVAESWETSFKSKSMKFVNQLEISRLEKQGELHGLKKRLVGTVAVTIKVDKDLKEPPATVGLIQRLLVVPAYRRAGIAQELVLAAWDQCCQHLRAVELEVNGNQELARKFFEKQEWALISVVERHILGFIKEDTMIYRRPCKRFLDETL